jgi:hypothetical protein
MAGPADLVLTSDAGDIGHLLRVAGVGARGCDV